jgi:hypothetical protein
VKKLEFAKLLELAIDECINISNMAKEKGEELFNSLKDGLDDNPEYKYYLYLKKLSYSKMERLYLMLSVPTYSRVNSMDALSVLEYQKGKEDELSALIKRNILEMEKCSSDAEKRKIKSNIDNYIEKQKQIRSLDVEGLKVYILSSLGISKDTETRYEEIYSSNNSVDETKILKNITESKETLNKFFKIVKDYNELRNELSSLELEESILLSDVALDDNGFANPETLDKMANEMRDYLQELSTHDMDVKNNLNKEMGHAFYNLISTGYHHMTTIDEIVPPYDLKSLNDMKSKLSDSLIEQAKLQNEEWKRLNEKLFKTEDVNKRIYQLSVEIDLTKSEIDKMIRAWYKKTFADNDIYSVASNRVNGYLKYSLGAKEHLKNFIDNGEWPSDGEISLIEQARILKKEETEVKLLRVEKVKEQLETTYKDRRDNIERKLIKTEKSLSDLVGNYKNSSIMSIISDSISNNKEL